MPHLLIFSSPFAANFKIYVTRDLNNLGRPLYHWRSPRDDKWYPVDINIGFQTQFDDFYVCLSIIYLPVPLPISVLVSMKYFQLLLYCELCKPFLFTITFRLIPPDRTKRYYWLRVKVSMPYSRSAWVQFLPVTGLKSSD